MTCVLHTNSSANVFPCPNKYFYHKHLFKNFAFEQKELRFDVRLKEKCINQSDPQIIENPQTYHRLS